MKKTYFTLSSLPLLIFPFFLLFLDTPTKTWGDYLLISYILSYPAVLLVALGSSGYRLKRASKNPPKYSAAQILQTNPQTPALEAELQTTLAWEENLEHQQKITERIALVPFLLYGLPFLLVFVLPFLWETLLETLF